VASGRVKGVGARLPQMPLEEQVGVIAHTRVNPDAVTVGREGCGE
jgi:hypothetical protein